MKGRDDRRHRTAARRICKCVCLATILIFILTGCSAKEYKNAENLFSLGDYKGAKTIFSQLDDYKDSAAMVRECDYQCALSEMVRENYQEAEEILRQLGDYKDCSVLIEECQYQCAVSEIEQGSYADAISTLQQLGDYKDSTDWLKTAKWEQLYDYIEIEGKPGSSIGGVINTEGSRILTKSDGASEIGVFMPDRETVCFCRVYETNSGGIILQSFALETEKDEPNAEWNCSCGIKISILGANATMAEVAKGRVHIPECTWNTTLVVEEFQSEGKGSAASKSSKDYNDAVQITATVLRNCWSDIFKTVPKILESTGLEITLEDIGFTGFQ